MMGTEQEKFKKSKRLLKDENAVKKQTKIAKEFGVPVEEPHKFAKHHAMNCGNPKCHMCGNPRKVFKELTQQEKRLFQDVDTPTDRHSNGLKPDDKEDLL
jgi:hypothetical protein